MKQLLTALLFFVCYSTSAQNIVPNPNFATYDTCPNTYSQLRYCTYWHSPNVGTPDYFNACTSSALSVPTNLTGYQASASGAYAGGYTYAQGSGTSEYIAVDIPALAIGDTYKVTVTVSLADSSTHGSNGFGVYFYKQAKPDSTWPGPITYTPQVSYDSYGVIRDKTNWVTLTKNFVADSAYTHLIIGNFHTEAATAVIMDSAITSSVTPFAYYYYGLVDVEKIGIGVSVHDPASSDALSTSPNPFTDKTTLYIGTGASQNTEVALLDMTGKTVVTKNVTGTDHVTIDRNGLPAGVYIYRVRDSSGTVTYGKITAQ